MKLVLESLQVGAPFSEAVANFMGNKSSFGGHFMKMCRACSKVAHKADLVVVKFS
jgi:hypothetical protein